MRFFDQAWTRNPVLNILMWPEGDPVKPSPTESAIALSLNGQRQKFAESEYHQKFEFPIY